jgi:acyl carrier protein
MTQDIENRLIDALYDVLEGAVKKDEIEADTQLLEGGLSLDSMALLHLLNRIEDNFDIEVEDEDLEQGIFRSVSSLTKFIEKKL